MPAITITFDHPQACVPKFVFGDRIAVKDDNSPKHWLTGEVIGMTLEQEVLKPQWWYSVMLDSPIGYTEEHTEDKLVAQTEIQGQPIHSKAPLSLPKFQPGMRVKLNAESGFQNLIKDFAEVVSSKYVSNDTWSGWTYKLTNKNFTRLVEIGEIWLELVP